MGGALRAPAAGVHQIFHLEPTTVKDVHLDDPHSTRLWSCKYPVRTACTRWLSNESGVTKRTEDVTCPDCKEIVSKHKDRVATQVAEESMWKKETAARVAEARRQALARRREKAVADQAAKEERAKRMKSE